jgi:glycosyltransferase involved in cell wall biosynthesis
MTSHLDLKGLLSPFSLTLTEPHTSISLEEEILSEATANQRNLSFSPDPPRVSSESYRVFFSTAPVEGEFTGDGSYVDAILHRFEQEGVPSEYVQASSQLDGNELYDLSKIRDSFSHLRTLQGREQAAPFEKAFTLFRAEEKRLHAVQRVLEYILNTSGENKIFNLQFRPPDSGLMFMPEDIRFFQSKKVKVVITCHDWVALKNKPHIQKVALEYFRCADLSIFLNLADQKAVLDSIFKVDRVRIPTSLSVVPLTITGLSLPSVESIFSRPPNILVFGIVRRNKGFEEAIALARLIKEREGFIGKVIIAGKLLQREYTVHRIIAPALGLGRAEAVALCEEWRANEYTLEWIQEKLTCHNQFPSDTALPVEIYFNPSAEKMQAIIQQCKYSYKADGKGFCNNASSMINMLGNTILFSKWGCLTDTRFTARHLGEIKLTSVASPSCKKGATTEMEGPFYGGVVLTERCIENFKPGFPLASEVLEKILSREREVEQVTNHRTLLIAQNAMESVFKVDRVASGVLESLKSTFI